MTRRLVVWTMLSASFLLPCQKLDPISGRVRRSSGAGPTMAGWEERFDDYVGRLGDVLGHADRRAPLRSYTTGLLLPGGRKSVEPMAARLDPGRVGAAHQSLHHFVAKAAWDDATLLAAVRAYPYSCGCMSMSRRPQW